MTGHSDQGYQGVTDNPLPSKPTAAPDLPLDWEKVEALIAGFPEDGSIPEFLRRNPDNTGGAKDWKRDDAAD